MEEENNESYRDKIATVDKHGKRIWVYPKRTKGKWLNRRKILTYVLLGFLFVAPFIKVNGNPLFMFNVVERKFSLFGQIFFPQDFYLFALVMMTGVISVVLFTLVFGRLFCGWVCPQTIFMEGVFRQIEYWIEGDAAHQRKLNKSPWNTDKVLKKTLKHGIFLAISFYIANTFLAYIIGVDELIEIVTSPPSEHMQGLISIIVFSLVFYGVFAFMREQVCTTVCPYGRLQGVLLDRNSMVITYDYGRGEKRSKFRKNEDRAAVGKGDCIDCFQCVKVCPTGIDIRDGTQLECINCTACIDECDNIMTSIGKKPGLIRYASEESIKTGIPFKFTLKAKAYSVVLSVMMIVVMVIIFTRSPIDVTALRVRGTDYAKTADGRISNLYDINILNKMGEDKDITLSVLEGEAELVTIKEGWVLKKDGEFKGKFMLIMDKSGLDGKKAYVKVGVFSEGEQIGEVEVDFIGPIL